MKTKLLSLLLSLALCGCGNPITDLINKNFPPISEEAQRQTALHSAAQSLSAMTMPSIGVGVGLGDAKKVLLDDSLRKEGIDSLEIKGDDQLLRVQVSFKRKFGEKDAGSDDNLKRALSVLQPDIEGLIEAFVGVGSVLDQNAPGGPTLTLNLLPGISRVQIDKLKVAGSLDATKSVTVLTDLLNRYRDNIAGEITRAKFATAVIPLASDKPLDISKTMTFKAEGAAAEVVVTGTPIHVPVKLDSVSWLVDSDQVIVLVQLTPLAAKPEQVKIEEKFGPIKHQFYNLVEGAFKIDGSNSWVAVRKELIATVVNSSVTQANACVTVKGAAHQTTSSKIPMPNGGAINCSSSRSCESSRRCSFDASKDQRDCSTCLISRPVICAPKLCGFGGCFGGGCTPGGCAQHGNDLTCEIAKAAQNQAYLLDANLRKADCDRLRAMETAGCQAEVLAAQGLCQAGKATLDALSKTGNFANVDVDANLHSDGMRVCLQEFSISSGLDRIAFALDVTGKAKADIDVKFTPLDIVGHLACQFPWNARQQFDAELRDSRIPFETKVELVTSAGSNPHLAFSTTETTIKANLSPGPTEFLLRNPMMSVSCAGLNLIQPLVVALTPFIKELRGDIDYKVTKREASFDLPSSTLVVAGHSLTITPSQNDRALVLNATMPK